MSDTWNEAKLKLGLTDFTPNSQDIAAAYKLITRDIVSALDKNDFNTAIQRGSPEWASLPYSGPENKNANPDTDPKSYYPNQPAAARTILRKNYDNYEKIERFNDKK